MSDTSTAATGLETAKELGILPEEFGKIKEILGREPNFNELSIYSVMWSEHCSYKNSIVWLKTLPKDGPHMLVKAGEENAGLVDIGDGLACAFKIESHNLSNATASRLARALSRMKEQKYIQKAIDILVHQNASIKIDINNSLICKIIANATL